MGTSKRGTDTAPAFVDKTLLTETPSTVDTSERYANNG